MSLLERRRARPLPASLEDDALAIAVALLAGRMIRIPAADRADLLELFKELDGAEQRGELDSVIGAILEILEQRPMTGRPLDLTEAPPAADSPLAAWLSTVSGRIKSLRTAAGLSQAELAARSGLPQSHVSRLEAAKHSPTRLTLEKIATALGRPLKELDPEAE
jgi:DNA-binding XRE family transcriptional regulator